MKITGRYFYEVEICKINEFQGYFHERATNC